MHEAKYIAVITKRQFNHYFKDTIYNSSKRPLSSVPRKGADDKSSAEGPSLQRGLQAHRFQPTCHQSCARTAAARATLRASCKSYHTVAQTNRTQNTPDAKCRQQMQCSSSEHSLRPAPAPVAAHSPASIPSNSRPSCSAAGLTIASYRSHHTPPSWHISAANQRTQLALLAVTAPAVHGDRTQCCSRGSNPVQLRLLALRGS